MSKIIYSFLAVAALCIFTHTDANAQYKQGDNLLNAGIGLGVLSYGGLPIGASFEHGFTKDISVGGFFDYLSFTQSYLSSYSYTWRVMYFGARGSYHLNEILSLDNEKIDIYGGAGLGYRVFSSSDTFLSGYDGYGNSLFLNLHAGGRYYFSNNFGGFAELGYGVSTLKLGLTAKF
jgi:hypothetical protein